MIYPTFNWTDPFNQKLTKILCNFNNKKFVYTVEFSFSQLLVVAIKPKNETYYTQELRDFMFLERNYLFNIIKKEYYEHQ